MIWAWISFVGAFLDLSIKQGIERLPKEDYPAPLSGSGGMIRIHQFHNLGLPFGHMQGRDRFVKYLPLMMGSLILGKLSAFSSLLAGAMSNLTDRFGRGYVVDYFSVEIGPLKKIIFNIGDIFVFIGSILFVINNFVFGGKKKNE